MNKKMLFLKYKFIIAYTYMFISMNNIQNKKKNYVHDVHDHIVCNHDNIL